MKRKKILLIDLGVPFGGIETYLVSLSQILKGEAELYAVCVNARLREALRDKNVRVVPERALKDHGKAFNLLAAAFLLVWLRIRFRISIVWVQGYSEIALLPIARLLGCRAVATRHLSLMHSHARSWRSNPGSVAAKKLYEWLAFTANKIFCVSEAVASDLRQIVKESRLAVIPNWVPTIPISMSVVPKGHGLHLLFVGRLQAHKGAAFIINAMHQMQNEDNSNPLSLTIVGEGECRQELENLARGLNVRFVGFQKDPWRFYREADVYINPSQGPEGLPLVSLEAMSYGLPCIFSDLKVHREITRDGEAALLFSSGDASDLSIRIQHLLTSEEARQHYAERARAVILANHSPQVARIAYLDQLEALGKAA